MKPLNFENALQLYEILGKHIPEIDDAKDIDALEFIGKIVDNIVHSDRHDDYLNSISLMTNMSIKDIISYNVEEIITIFSDGLAINQILKLVEFCKQVNYNGR